MARKYRERTELERQPFVEIGNEAEHGVVLPAYSARAQRTRRLPVTLPSRLTTPRWRSAQPFSKLLDDFLKLGCLLPGDVHVSEEGPVHHANVGGICTLQSLSDKHLWQSGGFSTDKVVKSLSQVLRAERKQKRTEEAAAAAAVLDTAQKHAEAIVQRRAGLQRMACQWQSYPHLCPQLVAVVSAANLELKTSDVSTETLAARWCARHVAIPQSSWTGPPPEALPRKPCFAKSCCLCSRRGKLTRALGNQVLRYLKASLLNNQVLAKAILSGQLMLHWQGTQTKDPQHMS